MPKLGQYAGVVGFAIHELFLCCFSQFSFEQSAKRPHHNKPMFDENINDHTCRLAKKYEKIQRKKQAVVSYCILQRTVGISNLALNATFDLNRVCHDYFRFFLWWQDLI